MQIPPSSSLLQAVSSWLPSQQPQKPAEPIRAVTPAGKGLGQTMERKAGEQQGRSGTPQQFVQTPSALPTGPAPRRGSLVNILA